MTTKDFRELDGNGFRVFISTTNSKGRQLVTIVKGEDSRNKNDGEKIYQKEFNNFNSVEDADYAEAVEAVDNAKDDETENMEYVISAGSCNGEEEQFAAFVKKTYPKMNVSIENVYSSTFRDADGNDVDEQLFFNGDLWEKYCNQ